MGRAKLNLELIQDKNARKTSYKKRRAGLEKKAFELKTLCGVEVAMIIFPSEDYYSDDNNSTGEQEIIWPNDPNKIKELITKYRQQSIEEQMRRTMNLSHFFEDRKRKVEDEVVKLKRKNEETKYYSLWDERYNNLSEEQLREFEFVLENKIQNLKAMLAWNGKRLPIKEEECTSNDRTATAIVSHQNLPVNLPIIQHGQNLNLSMHSGENSNLAFQFNQNPNLSMHHNHQNPNNLSMQHISQNPNNLSMQHISQNPNFSMQHISQNPNPPAPPMQHSLVRRRSMQLELEVIEEQPIATTLHTRGPESSTFNPNQANLTMMLMNNNTNTNNNNVNINNYALLGGAPANNFMSYQTLNLPFQHNQQAAGGMVESSLGSNTLMQLPYAPPPSNQPIQQFVHQHYPMLPGSSPQMSAPWMQNYYHKFHNFQSRNS